MIRYLRNPNPRITVKLLRAFGATIGSRTTIKRSLILDNVYEDQDSVGDFARLRIGQNCYVGDGVFFDLANEIIIEDDTVIAGRASFVTHSDCNRSVYLSEKFPRKTGPIVVGSGAWIGFGATVLHGVAVGNNSVIASNALLLEDTEPRSVYAGIPARKLRRIE